MAHVPQFLDQHILDAYPQNVCIVAITQSNGYVQMSPRGSVFVYDRDTMAYWDRGAGTTFDTVKDGTKVTIYYRHPEWGGGKGMLPAGGIARFYGTAEVHAENGEVREKVWNGMIQVERDRDPDKKGCAVLVRLENAEQLNHKPLSEVG